MEIDTTLIPLITKYPGIATWVGSPTVDLAVASTSLNIPLAELRKYVDKAKGIQATKLDKNVVKVESLLAWAKRQTVLVNEKK
jgi:hypothetical protein